ncbi:MAG: hypothetical protein IPN33_08040 [Saprospiraceae bacterium]|nr:hypothetical protein [Saprospiraceae bacterium]
MYEIIIGSVSLSLLHALLPNHWLPVLALGRSQHWSQSSTERLTLIAGLAHALSTILIGLLIGYIGHQAAARVETFTHLIAPAILIGMGIFLCGGTTATTTFILKPKGSTPNAQGRLVFLLMTAMFFSPCLEIEAFFLAAGAYGWPLVFLIALLYLIISVVGMWTWVHWAYPRLLHLNWHRLEHNAGLITGAMLILTGILGWLLH